MATSGVNESRASSLAAMAKLALGVFVDGMSVNMDKFIIEVALELMWPSLRVKLSLGHRKGSLICSALHTIDVPVDVGGAVLLGFPFPRGAVDADVEDCATTERRERK